MEENSIMTLCKNMLQYAKVFFKQEIQQEDQVILMNKEKRNINLNLERDLNLNIIQFSLNPHYNNKKYGNNKILMKIKKIIQVI